MGVVLLVSITALLVSGVGVFTSGVVEEANSPAPEATFEFEVSDDGVVVTHISGDTLDGDQLRFDGAATEKTTTGSITEWQGTTVEAGDSAVVTTTEGRLWLVWENPESTSSSILAAEDVPATRSDSGDSDSSGDSGDSDSSGDSSDSSGSGSSGNSDGTGDSSDADDSDGTGDSSDSDSSGESAGSDDQEESSSGDSNEFSDSDHLILHYDFESGSGDTVVDRTGNGNDGTVEGDDISRVSSGMYFDRGQWDEGAVRTDGGLSDSSGELEDTSEFTVAVAYEPATTDCVQNLIQYTGGDEWFLEQCGDSVRYANEWSGESGRIGGGSLDIDERNVVVGTYDGEEMELYVNGERVAGQDTSGTVELGNIEIGEGEHYRSTRQGLEGNVYDVRLYDTHVNDSDVDDLTSEMG